MERGDIYFVSLDPTSGHEQQGTRPVLIVSPGAFNRLTKTPVVLPITSGGAFTRMAGFAVSLMAQALEQRALSCAPSHARWMCSPAAAARWKACLATSWMMFWQSWPRSLNEKATPLAASASAPRRCDLLPGVWQLYCRLPPNYIRQARQNGFANSGGPTPAMP